MLMSLICPSIAQSGMSVSCLRPYGEQGPLPAEDRLLLEIYSQLTEPDGIYAVARSHKLASQLHLFRHEGSWSKALLGCDLLVRYIVLLGAALWW